MRFLGRAIRWTMAGLGAGLLSMLIFGLVVAVVGAVSNVDWLLAAGKTMSLTGAVGMVVGLFGARVLNSLLLMAEWMDPPETKLFRSVTSKEIELIKAADWNKFPPRIVDEPVFYPTATKDQAARSAIDLSKLSGQGTVVEFPIAFGQMSGLLRYMNKDGDRRNDEDSWLLVETLNRNLRGPIVAGQRFVQGQLS